MDWSQVVGMILAAILPVITGFIIKWLNTLFESISRTNKMEIFQSTLENLNEIIHNAVVYTNQTYVDSITKNGGKLTREQAVQAFNLAYEAVENSISEKQREILEEFISDLATYIEIQIEAAVNRIKELRAAREVG